MRVFSSLDNNNERKLMYLSSFSLVIISFVIGMIYWRETNTFLEILIICVIPILIFLYDILLGVFSKETNYVSIIYRYLYLPLLLIIHFYMISITSIFYEINDKPVLLASILTVLFILVLFIMTILKRCILNKNLTSLKLSLIVLKYLTSIIIIVSLIIFVFLSNFTSQ